MVPTFRPKMKFAMHLMATQNDGAEELSVTTGYRGGKNGR
jgi:hypothetical protein